MAKKVTQPETDLWELHPPGAMLSAFFFGLEGVKSLQMFFNIVNKAADQQHAITTCGQVLWIGVNLLDSAFTELKRKEALELLHKLDLVHQADPDLVRHGETSGQSYGAVIYKLLFWWKTHLKSLTETRATEEILTGKSTINEPISVDNLLLSPRLGSAFINAPVADVDELRDLLTREYRKAFPLPPTPDDNDSASKIASTQRIIFPEEGDPRDLWLYLYENQGKEKYDNELAREWSSERGPTVLNSLRKDKSSGAISDWR